MLGSMMRNPQGRAKAGLFLAALAAQVMSLLTLQFTPLLMSGFMSGLKVGGAEAGFLLMLEFGALGLTSLASAMVRLPWSPRQMLIGGALVATAAHAVSLAMLPLPAISALRLIAGIGEGLAYATCLSMVAVSFRDPDRIFALLQTVSAGIMAFGFGIGGALTEAHAHRGLLGLVIAASIALLPLMFLTPRALRFPAPEGGGLSISGSGGGLIVVLAMLLYMLASAGLYAVTDLLAARVGMSTTQSGWVLSIAAALGLLGAGFAAWLGLRVGRLSPLLGSLGLYLIVGVILCFSHDPMTFSIGLIATVWLYYFSLPYIFGLASAVDPTGRCAAATGATYLAGYTLGPFMFGFVTHSDSAMAALYAVFYAASMALFFIANRTAPKISASAIPASVEV